MLFEGDIGLAANIQVAQSVRATLDARLGEVDIHEEYMDRFRFPEAAAGDAFDAMLVEKYGDLPLDAVLVFGSAALECMIGLQDRMKSGAPVIFGGVNRATAEAADLPDGYYGVVNEYSPISALSPARALQPDAKSVTVFAGSAPFDEHWMRSARQEFSAVSDLDFDYVAGLTVEEFETAAAALDPDSILVLLSFLEDPAGSSSSSIEVSGRIAASSAAPAYGVYPTYVGNGVVGGMFSTFEDVGTAAATAATEIMSGSYDGPAIAELALRPILDWRALDRHGLGDGSQLLNAEIRFHRPSVFELDPLEFSILLAIMLLQGSMIAALVLQRRKRRHAEASLARNRRELTRLSRASVIKELSGSFAHELNQPLTAILANAEAGLNLLSRKDTDLGEIREILSDIAADDRRAGAIIAELRRMMTNEDPEFRTVDLDALVASTTLLLESEFAARGVRVDEIAAGGMRVSGSRVQLQQVLINLILNSMDAMEGAETVNRQITITTAPRADWCEMAVEDSGPGLPDTPGFTPFEAFSSTKPGSLGIGLAICRTIVDAHGGSIRFDRSVRAGTRVVVTLPAAG